MSAETRTRIIIGVLLGAAVIASMLYLPPFFTVSVGLVASVRAWFEYSRLMNLRNRPVLNYAGYVCVFGAYIHTWISYTVPWMWVWISWVLGFILLYLESCWERWKKQTPRSEDTTQTWTDFVRYVMGTHYVYMLYGVSGLVAYKPQGLHLILMTIAIVALGDSFAFFAGRSYGKHKLWLELSPKKSIEGGLGSLAGSLLTASVCWFLLFRPTGLYTLQECLLFALIANPLAQAGDFLESLMKRVSGTKDSGGLLPGHGGLLDRTDGFALVFPLLYYYFLT